MLMENHDIPEAERSIMEILKSVDLPAVSELILHMFKYMLQVMSRDEFLDVCQVLRDLLETSSDVLLRTDVECG